MRKVKTLWENGVRGNKHIGNTILCKLVVNINGSIWGCVWYDVGNGDWKLTRYDLQLFCVALHVFIHLLMWCQNKLHVPVPAFHRRLFLYSPAWSHTMTCTRRSPTLCNSGIHPPLTLSSHSFIKLIVIICTIMASDRTN